MKNLCLSLLILMAVPSITLAQYDPSKVNKKAIESYDKGIEKAQGGKYDDAIESFQEAIRRDAGYIDAYLSMAGVY
jgi:Tfp pilus assembly protein PilF